jgi:hypothetical protein
LTSASSSGIESGKGKAGNAMEGYRAFIIGPDGHVTDRVDLPGLTEVTEEEAKKRAKQL